MYIYDPNNSESHKRAPGGLGFIIGVDNRQRVRETSKAPYRWICALDLLFPFKGKPQLNKGTGFLISLRYVLTAGHNVMPFKGVKPLSIKVIPGLDGVNLLGKQQAPVGSQQITPGQAPVGSLAPAKWWIPSQYQTSLDPAWDFALLTLPDEFPPLHGMTFGHWTDRRYAPRPRSLL